ncbi:MAG: hypothetical protein U1F57_11885 [bacterium]
MEIQGRYSPRNFREDLDETETSGGRCRLGEKAARRYHRARYFNDSQRQATKDAGKILPAST